MILDLQFFINMFFSLLDFTGFTILSLAIFRIPIMMYWQRLLLMQFAFLGVMLIHEQLLMNKDFYAISITITAAVLSMFFLRLPLLFSSLMWGTGYLINVAMQVGVIIILTNTVIGNEQLLGDPLFRNLTMLLFFLINLSIVYFIERKRLGFMFIMNRFRLQSRAFQIKDFFVAVFFIFSISLAQLAILSFLTQSLNHYLIIVFGSMIVISLIGLAITYKFNMKEIDERFNSLRRKKP